MNSDFSSSASCEWKFSQIFGDKLPGEEVENVDMISTIEFDKTGNYLGVGDHGGRIIIFENNGGKDELLEYATRKEIENLDFSASKHPKFQYKTEFQSHEPEFDYLKSIEIEERINKIRWCPTPNGSLFMLSMNDRTIKLWQVKEHKIKQVKEMDIIQPISSENSLLADRSLIDGQQPRIANGHALEWKKDMTNGISPINEGCPKLAYLVDPTYARCRRVYARAHDFNTNSISINSDGETFLSGDDLRINLWNFEISSQCFNIIDMKPDNMEDLTEVITSAEFHPLHCNLLAYSSSRGFIRLVDMRLSALCDHTTMILKDEESHGPKSFFTEIISAMTNLKFANDGKHILSRDYMNLKLWDMRMHSYPVETYKIHENLRPKLCDLYNNDAIFDKFDCCIAGDRLSFATGSYSNLLRVFTYRHGSEGLTTEVGKNLNRKSQQQPSPRLRRSSLSNLSRGFSRQSIIEPSYDFNTKLLHMAWHPRANLIACAAGNSLLIYHS